MQKIYIYSFINKINGHRYIGKTNNIERRKREHLSLAYNIKNIETSNDCTWYKKIRQYGWNNFDFEILEIANEDNWAEREQYWIKYYNTYLGVGYNETPGGDDGSHLEQLTKEESEEVKNLLLNSKLTQRQIAEKYNISEAVISNINQGQRYIDSNLQYPLRKNYKKGLQDYGELIQLLKTTDMTFKAIAIKLGMSESSVKKINYGKMWFDPQVDYPIRKHTSYDYKTNKIIELLTTTNLTNTEIAQQVGCSPDTVSRINNGRSHKQKNIAYPLRK